MASRSRSLNLPGPHGQPIGVSVQGAGAPAVMMIHGWCCHRAVWRHQADAWSRGTLVLPDLPGHGASPAPTQAGDLSIAALGLDMVALADALGLGDMILVGHSLGGAVAVEAAVRLADRCRLVIGVDTFTDAAFYRRRPAEEIDRRRRPFEVGFVETIDRMVRRITLCGAGAADRIAAAMSRCDPAVALPLMDALLAWDVEARWPALSCPAVTINSAILSGGGEPPLDLAGLRTVLMDRVGHFPMIEDPAAFQDQLQEILWQHG